MNDKQGIYTLDNDAVYDQLIALLNSIEKNIGKDIKVCIIPYDNKMTKVKKAIQTRKNVVIFKDDESIEYWDNFVKNVWESHSQAKKTSHSQWVRSNLHRRWTMFSGPLEKFVFYDADSLAMKPIDKIFKKLEEYDFVFDDWEHNKKEPFAALNISIIESTGLFTRNDIIKGLHGVDFFGANRSAFTFEKIEKLKKLLVENREVEWINSRGWWDDSFLFCYLTLRLRSSYFNYAQSKNSLERTGNCANIDPFVNIDNVLYNQEGLKPIHRIHYMCYRPYLFKQLVEGFDVGVPHQDVFLYYRLLHELDRMPKKLRKRSFQLREWKKFIKNLKG